MTHILKEFREFAVKGNVVDMAVGVVIGAAFGKIVTSLVSDLIMPPIGLLVGGVNFTQLKLVLVHGAADGVGEVAIRYGTFLQTAFDFLIVAWAVFVAIKLLNKLKRQAPAKGSETPPPPPPEVQLLTEIRDLLRNK